MRVLETIHPVHLLHLKKHHVRLVECCRTETLVCCCLEGEKWIQCCIFQEKLITFYLFRGGKWRISVLGVFIAYFCAGPGRCGQIWVNAKTKSGD